VCARHRLLKINERFFKFFVSPTSAKKLPSSHVTVFLRVCQARGRKSVLTIQTIHQNLDNCYAGLSLLAQPGQGRLQDSPCDCLARQGGADNHRAVSRVLGLVQLNHLNDRLRQRLQCSVFELSQHSLLQLHQQIDNTFTHRNHRLIFHSYIPNVNAMVCHCSYNRASASYNSSNY